MEGFPEFPPFETPEALSERLRKRHEERQLDAARRAARSLSEDFKGLGEYCVRPDWSGPMPVSDHMEEAVAARLGASFEAALRAAGWEVNVVMIDHPYGWNYIVEASRKPGVWARLCRAARFFWGDE